jgi:hypothetical protein
VTMGCIGVGAHGSSTDRDAKYPHRAGTRRVDALPTALMASYRWAPSLIHVWMRSTWVWLSTFWSSGMGSPQGGAICCSFALTLLNSRLVVALPGTTRVKFEVTQEVPAAFTPTRFEYAVCSVDMSSMPNMKPLPDEWQGKHCTLMMVEYTSEKPGPSEPLPPQATMGTASTSAKRNCEDALSTIGRTVTQKSQPASDPSA